LKLQKLQLKICPIRTFWSGIRAQNSSGWVSYSRNIHFDR